MLFISKYSTCIYKIVHSLLNKSTTMYSINTFLHNFNISYHVQLRHFLFKNTIIRSSLYSCHFSHMNTIFLRQNIYLMNNDIKKNTFNSSSQIILTMESLPRVIIQKPRSYIITKYTIKPIVIHQTFDYSLPPMV